MTSSPDTTDGIADLVARLTLCGDFFPDESLDPGCVTFDTFSKPGARMTLAPDNTLTLQFTPLSSSDRPSSFKFHPGRTGRSRMSDDWEILNLDFEKVCACLASWQKFPYSLVELATSLSKKCVFVDTLSEPALTKDQKDKLLYIGYQAGIALPIIVKLIDPVTICVGSACFSSTEFPDAFASLGLVPTMEVWKRLDWLNFHPISEVIELSADPLNILRIFREISSDFSQNERSAFDTLITAISKNPEREI